VFDSPRYDQLAYDETLHLSFQTLTVTETSTISLIKGCFKVLSVVESSIMGLIKGWFKTLSVIEIGVPAFTRKIGKFLSVVETSVAGFIKKMFKTLSVSQTISAIYDEIFYDNEVYQAGGNVCYVSMMKKLSKPLSILESSVINLVKKVSKTFSLIANCVIVISKITTFYRTIASIVVCVPSFIKQRVYFVVMSVIESFVASLSSLFLGIWSKQKGVSDTWTKKKGVTDTFKSQTDATDTWKEQK